MKEMLKWMLLPITFPLLVCLFWICVLMMTFGTVAVMIFDSIAGCNIVPMSFLSWLGGRERYANG